MTPLNSDASTSRVPRHYQRTPTIMVGGYATPEADITITHHLPPQEDVSMSFVIPSQADASNLLDQNCDDFFSGQGFVTLSTPVPPRHLLNTRDSMRKATQTASRPVLGHPASDRTDLLEAHTSPLPPTKSFTGPPTPVSAASAVGPGSPGPREASPRNKRDGRIHNGLKPNAALSKRSIATTEPGIQSMPTSAASCHSTNTQISRQPPTPAPPKKNKEPGQTRGGANVRSIQATSKLRNGDVPVCKTTATSVSCDRFCQPSWDSRISGWDRMAQLD